MTSAAAEAHWHCPRPDTFAIQSWPDGVVVYDDASGSLHALNPVAGEAFSLILAQRVISTEGLAVAMGLAEPGPEDLEVLQSLLDQFESMGLIECTQG